MAEYERLPDHVEIVEDYEDGTTISYGLKDLPLPADDPYVRRRQARDDAAESEIVSEFGPAPERPTMEDGKSRAGDQRRLAAKGLVSIGTGYFPGAEPEARGAALEQGRAVDADRILFYPPADDAGADWIAVYYVRFQLPFGATFRDLRAGERKALGGAGGVVLGSIVGGTPASRANLLPGDMVVRCEGKAIADRSAFQAMPMQRPAR